MANGIDRKTGHNTGQAKAEISLSEELQSIVSGLSGAESDAEAEKGLARLKRLREEIGSSGAAAAVREKAEKLLNQTEERIEKLHNYLVRKRRMQEGEVMEEIAERREAETDIVGTLTSAAIDGPAPSPAREKEAPEEGSENEPLDEAVSPSVRLDPAPPAQETPAVQPAPAQEAPKRPEYEWNRAYRIAAHMAASVTEDGKYFEKLRKTAVKPGDALPAPADHAEAEKHFRAVHGLNVRLINIELKIKAIAKAYKNNRPVSDLFATASNEIKGFMRDYKARRDEMPGMSAEYERLFGGYAERFASMPAPKGGGILDRCLLEQRNDAPAVNRDGPHMAPGRGDR